MVNSSDARLSLSWDRLLAPRMVEVIPGCATTHCSETCAGDLPICLLTSSSTSRILQLLSVNLLNGLPFVRRPSPVPVLPSRLYLPVRKPPPSGLQDRKS